MAASRRAQIQALCGVRAGPLIDRVESYLAAVDIWSRRGNAKAVKNAGTGIVAVCCYLAAQSLEAHIPDRATAIRASGLTPEKFGAAERDFRTAVQSVSTPSAQALSGPSDAATSAFAASLGAGSTPSAVRSSTLAASSSAGASSKEALLAKAQAIQAGSLFDRTMRSAPETSAAKTPTRPGAVQAGGTNTATPTQQTSGAAAAVSNGEANASEGGGAIATRQRAAKRRRMGKVVFGLAVHSSLNRLNNEQEASDERARRRRINEIQATMDELRAGKPTWRYLDSPGDFLVAISARAESRIDS